MNIQSLVARLTRPAQVIERCVARHDGGYLVLFSDGRAGVSSTPLAVGACAILTASGAVEAVR